MKWIFTLALSILLVPFGSSLKAQVSCEYTLELFDSFGDGWNGAALTITINGTPTVYTLDNINDDGFFNSFSITITDGDVVIFSYIPGFFENEVSYNFIDTDGIIIFQDGPFPEIGDDVFSATLVCPSCPVAPPSSVSVDDVRAFTADISWTTSDPDGVYLIEYDTTGFEQGAGANVLEATGSSGTLTGLQENTAYNFYLSVACANGDTSIVIGPYSFMTLWNVDVGLVDILTPQSQCGLGVMDTIEVILRNFGGSPQSLIPFNFSVNGIPGGVNQPIDGFFTGVLGTDSTFTIPFETFFDLSEPGEYVIMAWTELEGDSDLSNDTSTITIVNIPIVTEYPYFTDFEEWSGGWSVADDSQNPSWAFGEPAGTIISSAASGVNAWVTNLEGTYNNSELSYLISPCFDFADLEDDPRIAFSLNFDSESCCDELWLEVSTDSGETWSKVGAAGTGNNWYNDTFNNWWDGTGGFSGWVTAFNTLTGTAGFEAVRLRFVLSTDFSVIREGAGIDDIFISPPLTDDLASLSVDHTTEEDCGAEVDQVVLNITNLGTAAQTGFDVSYQVNGGNIVTENVGPLTLNPGEQTDYTFVTPFNSATPGSFEVVAWTDLQGELFLPNDTASFSFVTAIGIPFAEDFESGVFPSGWSTDDGFVTNAHNNVSFVLADNLWSFDNAFFAVTPVIGPVAEGDSLTFDYRFVDFSGGGVVPTSLGENDSLDLQISTDCGESYQTIFTVNSDNHMPTNQMTNIRLSLDSYVGLPVRFRFQAVWGQGDYWLDLDNINIKRCPASLDLAAQVTDATGEDAPNGSATVAADQGLEPFSFEWSTGATSATVDSLLPGAYLVTVSDAVGCIDVIEVVIDIMVATEEPPDQITALSLAPNPTTGLTNLQVQFARPVDARIQLLNLVGQILFDTFDRHVTSSEYQLDLSRHAGGLYFVRVIVEEEVKTKKLIRVGM